MLFSIQDVDCPNNCGDKGSCQFRSYKQMYCNCSAGHIGMDCSLHLTGSETNGSWHRVRQGEGRELPHRTSHTAVVIKDCLWVFGGFNLNSALDDVWTFCMSNNEWQELVRPNFVYEDLDATMTKPIPWPSARSDHAAAVYEDGFYIFGGLLENGLYSDEMWYFNVTSRTWRFIKMNTSTLEVRLRITGHTLTSVEGDLYLVGGKLDDSTIFLGDMYKTSASHPTTWNKIFVKGGQYPPLRLAGHSTVYSKESHSLIIFGGYSRTNFQLSRRSNHMHMFSLDDLYWSDLHNKDWKKDSIPFERAYHSTVVMGNYLVVYGGYTHDHSELETCYSREMFFYHLGCHVWLNHTYFTGKYLCLFLYFC